MSSEDEEQPESPPGSPWSWVRSYALRLHKQHFKAVAETVLYEPG